jgi:ABC-type multidrug transport system ATPase subunit
MSDLIRLDDVTVQFGSLLALDHVSISVQSGEIVALTGQNGAGKSTALRVASGQISPTSGQSMIAGRPPGTAKAIVGILPDKDNHFEEFTARRNLAFFAALYGVRGCRIEECLRLVDLQPAADRPVREFSLGMRRRLLLARAVLHDPRILLLDEPFANLDAPGQMTVRDLLKRARADGAAVLYTSHGLDHDSMADRLITLDRGQVASMGSVETK